MTFTCLPLVHPVAGAAPRNAYYRSLSRQNVRLEQASRVGAGVVDDAASVANEVANPLEGTVLMGLAEGRSAIRSARSARVFQFETLL